MQDDHFFIYPLPNASVKKKRILSYLVISNGNKQFLYHYQELYTYQTCWFSERSINNVVPTKNLCCSLKKIKTVYSIKFFISVYTMVGTPLFSMIKYTKIYIYALLKFYIIIIQGYFKSI